MTETTDTHSVLGDALAGRYEIVKELGRGGMATVYLARDVKHDRDVAIKVLHQDLGAAIGPERFLREIKVAANLQHPNILPLFDSGEANGRLYYVMPFVEGESLGDRLKREGQLPIEAAVQVTREVADALDHAHKQGIIHRDIKPDNVMLVGKHAIVADFGIARAVEAGQAKSLTQTGMAVGTPLYMSPEQSSGEHVDGRADVYSLGCMLYELLSGEPPFTGKTASAIMARHAMEDLPDVRIVRPTVPDELQDAIDQATAKSPADRFATAGDFAEALGEAHVIVSSERLTARRTAQRRVHAPPPKKGPSKALLGGAAAVVVIAVAAWALLLRGGQTGGGSGAGVVAGLDATSVAVLYFSDLSPSGDLTYLADGLTEELIDRLSQVRELDVISRNGVAPYRDGAVARDSIARALSVGSLIAGEVERSGDRVRVTTRLVDGNSGAEFERASFELPADQLLLVKDSAAQVVASLFRTRLGEEIRTRERRAGTSSVDAWSLVLQAERWRKSGEDLIASDSAAQGFALFDRADSLLAQAQAADPQWIAPIVQRAQIAYRRTRLADDMAELFRWVDVGTAHAERALALDPNYPEALEARGNFRYWAWLNDREPDPEKAEALLLGAKADLEAAVDRDPTLASAYSMLSHLYYNTDDGITSVILAARTAYQEDAYLEAADRVLWRLFTGHYDLEQFPQASRWCTVGRERFPESFRFAECQLLVMATGTSPLDVDHAWQLQREVADLVPEPVREFQSSRAQMWVGGILARAGLPDSARAVLGEARVTPQVDPDYELSWLEAYMRVLLGDNDEAIRLLRLYLSANPGFDTGEPQTGDPYWWWRDLQEHPDYEEIRAVTM
jgi:serine/threonine-protein kinase